MKAKSWIQRQGQGEFSSFSPSWTSSKPEYLQGRSPYKKEQVAAYYQKQKEQGHPPLTEEQKKYLEQLIREPHDEQVSSEEREQRYPHQLDVQKYSYILLPSQYSKIKE